jgi:AcrR family transcriptional regulator
MGIMRSETARRPKAPANSKERPRTPPSADANDASSTAGGRGRPRDPEVDRRIFDAALDIYGESGLAAFHFDAVSRRAGVGKAALYRRWEDAEHLLLDALDIAHIPIEQIDTGSIRGDLLALTRTMMARYLDRAGMVTFRVMFDGVSEGPAGDLVREHMKRHAKGGVHAARLIIRRAIARGDLPRGVSPTLVLDTAIGAVLNHYLSTPRELRPAIARKAGIYTEQIVDFVLAAVLGTAKRAGSGEGERRSRAD